MHQVKEGWIGGSEGREFPEARGGLTPLITPTLISYQQLMQNPKLLHIHTLILIYSIQS